MGVVHKAQILVRQRDMDHMAVVIRLHLHEQVHLAEDELENAAEIAEAVIVQGVGRNDQRDIRIDFKDALDDLGIIDAVIHLALEREIGDLGGIERILHRDHSHKRGDRLQRAGFVVGVDVAGVAGIVQCFHRFCLLSLGCLSELHLRSIFRSLLKYLGVVFSDRLRCVRNGFFLRDRLSLLGCLLHQQLHEIGHDRAEDRHINVIRADGHRDQIGIADGLRIKLAALHLQQVFIAEGAVGHAGGNVDQLFAVALVVLVQHHEELFRAEGALRIVMEGALGLRSADRLGDQGGIGALDLVQAGEVRGVPVAGQIVAQLLQLLLLERGKRRFVLRRSLHEGLIFASKTVERRDRVAHVHVHGVLAPDSILHLHFLPAGEAVAGDGAVAEGGIGFVLPNVLRGGGERDHAAQTERHGDRQQHGNGFSETAFHNSILLFSFFAGAFNLPRAKKSVNAAAGNWNKALPFVPAFWSLCA